MVDGNGYASVILDFFVAAVFSFRMEQVVSEGIKDNATMASTTMSRQETAKTVIPSEGAPL